MKKDKNFQVCLDLLRSWQNRNESKPEQKRTFEGASKSLLKLRRMAHPDRATIFLVVRQIAEAISETLER